jgi:ParB-like chromosome segregation protein Spo0J
VAPRKARSHAAAAAAREAHAVVKAGELRLREATSDKPAVQVAHQRWRDVLPIHPAAELFPRMSQAELRELGEDIKRYGLRNPCCLVEDEYGRVVLIDGRNRLDALELIGEQITLDNSIIFERFPADSVDVAARIISLNIHRRHLTAEQKRELIATVIKATPDKSDRQIAETVKASPTTVGTVRAEMEATGDVSRLDTDRQQGPPAASEEIEAAPGSGGGAATAR